MGSKDAYQDGQANIEGQSDPSPVDIPIGWLSLGQIRSAPNDSAVKVLILQNDVEGVDDAGNVTIDVG